MRCACGTELIKPPWLNSTRSTPEVMMTSATRPANLMSLAPTVSRMRSSLRLASCSRALARASCNCSICAGTVPAQRPLGGHSLAPCESNRPVWIAAPVQASGMKVTASLRVLHRKRQRGSQLIAVERAVAGRRHPAGAMADPVAGGAGAGTGGVVVAGLVGLVAVTARPEIFAADGAEKAPEAEALVGERDRPVGIAFAGGDRVAKARDQQVADADLGRDALDAVVRPRDPDRRDGRLAEAHALMHRLRSRPR